MNESMYKNLDLRIGEDLKSFNQFEKAEPLF